MSASLAYITDPGIPGLSSVLNPLELGEQLRRFLPAQTKGLRDLQVRLIRHHPGKRCVVEVTGHTTEGSLSLIGKVYAKDRSDVYRLMEDVRRAGFGRLEEFSIPQPIAYLPELQFLLQEKVEGRQATESFLAHDESERTAAAEGCGRWLAKFHAIAPEIGPTYHLSNHLLSIEQWSRRLAALGQPFADKAGKLSKRLEAAASELQPIELRTIHGDYTHHQVVFAHRRTVAMDWDDYCLADRSDDVARFMVGLQRLALRCLGFIRALDGAAEAFLKTYVASGHSNITEPLAFQRAAICLEHAKHDVHKRAQGWWEKAEVTLDEGLRVLEQGS